MLALAVQALDRLPGFGAFISTAVHLVITDRGPVTDTALGIHRVTAIGIRAAATKHIELVTQHQAVTAALGQLVIAHFFRVDLGTTGYQRQLRAFRL